MKDKKDIPTTFRVVAADYWTEGFTHRSYRGIFVDRSDDQIDPHRFAGQLLAGAGAVDGEEVEVSVRRTGFRPFGERRVRLVGPHTYRRETEEEVGSLEAARRRAERTIGLERGREVRVTWDETIAVERLVEGMIVDAIPSDWGARRIHLWTEDEALRHDDTAEHFSGAFLRFSGRALQDLGKKLDRIDDGDSGFDLLKGGWVHGWSYNGSSLWRVATVTETGLPFPTLPVEQPAPVDPIPALRRLAAYIALRVHVGESIEVTAELQSLVAHAKQVGGLGSVLFEGDTKS